MTPVSLGDTVYVHVGTSSASTGAATNADSTPTVTVEEDGSALGYAPSVANVATGLYRVTIDCTGGNGFEAGRRYSVYVAATVGGITGRDGIAEFEVIAVDLNAALDVAMSSRLASASYTAPDNSTIAAILADTDNIQTRLPAALVSGRMASIAEVVGDKTGYALTQTFPPNFAAQSITAAGLVDITQAAADKAWGTSTRVLTAGTNIALAKGTGVTGFTDIDAAGVRSALGLGSANLDTQLGAMPTLAQLNAEIDAVQADVATVGAGVAGVLSDTNDIQARLPAALVGGRMDASVGALSTGSVTAIADEVMAYAVEAGLTTKQALRLIAAAVAGKISGASGTTVTIKNAVADDKNRIVATVDSDGNRTAITYDLTD